ncbi:GNAT family N-acetyltransferase [Bacillus salacetis]|uniref:GNAT family N-acetyltransferase n=1 Tax=Bacillus salacetis TaxID=2315464 RepID=A0A3A1R235_9BACI|nr:GNAT family N-acetyltransferase [Bacillus salacetis]RIW35131.1 GNAT family N-acetyltransferase [Bacillus salacetis]
MSYHIRKGNKEDIGDIMKIVRKTVEIMKSEDIDQWTDEYPLMEDFLKDSENDSLYVAVDEQNNVAGSITIDQNEPSEYASSEWNRIGPSYLFHRLVVDPDVRGKGIASLLIKQTEKVAKDHQIQYIRTDTYSLNKKAQSLFRKNGFKQTGQIQFMGKDNPFYTFDKILDV